MSSLEVINAIGIATYIIIFILVVLNWKKFPNKYFLFSFFNICLVPFAEMIQEIPQLDYSDYIPMIYAGYDVHKADVFAFKLYENYARRLAHCYLAIDRAYAVYFYQNYDKLQTPKFVFIQLAFIYVGAFVMALPIGVIPAFQETEVVFNEYGRNETTSARELSSIAWTYNTVVSVVTVGIITIVYLMIIKKMRQQKTSTGQGEEGMSQGEKTALKQAGTITLFQIHFAIVNNIQFFFDLEHPAMELYVEVAEWMELISPPFVFFGFSSTLRNFIVPKKLRNALKSKIGPITTVSQLPVNNVELCAPVALHENT